MDPKERYNAAAQRHSAALAAFIEKHKGSDLESQNTALKIALSETHDALDKARADYDALLNGVADYLEAAAAQIEAAETPNLTPAQ